MYKSYNDSPETPQKFSRKKRYEIVKPCLTLIKHELQGIKPGKKKNKKNKKKPRLAKVPTSSSSPEKCSEAEDSKLFYGSPVSTSSDLL